MDDDFQFYKSQEIINWCIHFLVPDQKLTLSSAMENKALFL